MYRVNENLDRDTMNTWITKVAQTSTSTRYKAAKWCSSYYVLKIGMTGAMQLAEEYEFRGYVTIFMAGLAAKIEVTEPKLSSVLMNFQSMYHWITVCDAERKRMKCEKLTNSLGHRMICAARHRMNSLGHRMIRLLKAGVSTNWIYFNVRQSTTRRRLLLAIREANGGFD
ncbi:hypothetical protein Tco_0785143 [Tanacetum coccineum]